MNIVLASNNAHKLEEFRKIFKEFGVAVFSLEDMCIKADPEEDGETFKANALIKAKAVAKQTANVVVADDSGLEIHALNNFPGIRSARFLEGSSYADKFIAINDMLKGKKDRSANFNCTLCVLNLEKDPLFFEGITSGEILQDPQGRSGFGYDPIFFCPEQKLSFAQMSQELKNKASHRGKAIKLFVEYLQSKKYI